MRALLELGETQLFGTVEGAAFAHAEAALGVLIGKPTEKTLRELTLCGLPPELLAREPVELAGYRWEPVSLSTGGGEGRGNAKRLSPAQWPLLPPELSASVAVAMERRAVFFEAVDGRPAALAWAPLKSERWFDLHVETLPAFQRRGLARSVVQAVVAHERHEGRSPVWGAPASNVAAVALGRSLGFVDCGQILWRATKRV